MKFSFNFNLFESSAHKSARRERKVIAELKAKNPISNSEKLPAFKPLLQGAKELKARATRIAGDELLQREAFDKPWGVYRRNIEEYFMTTSHEQVKQELLKTIHTYHAKGERVLALDLLGEAHGGSMGFDKTMTVTLTTDTDTPDPTIERLEGDIFSQQTQRALQQALEASQEKLLFVHCNPVAGLNGFVDTKNDHMYLYGLKQLEHVFELVWDHLDDQGIILLDIPNIIHVSSVNQFLRFLKEKNIPYTIDHVSNVIIQKRLQGTSETKRTAEV